MVRELYSVSVSGQLLEDMRAMQRQYPGKSSASIVRWAMSIGMEVLRGRGSLDQSGNPDEHPEDQKTAEIEAREPPPTDDRRAIRLRDQAVRSRGEIQRLTAALNLREREFAQLSEMQRSYPIAAKLASKVGVLRGMRESAIGRYRTAHDEARRLGIDLDLPPVVAYPLAAPVAAPPPAAVAPVVPPFEGVLVKPEPVPPAPAVVASTGQVLDAAAFQRASDAEHERLAAELGWK